MGAIAVAGALEAVVLCLSLLHDRVALAAKVCILGGSLCILVSLMTCAVVRLDGGEPLSASRRALAGPGPQGTGAAIWFPLGERGRAT